MAAVGSRIQRRNSRVALPDPFYWIWRRLTSVKVAIYLILTTAFFAGAGVIIPQVPPQFTGDLDRIQAHVDAQRGTFGPATDILAEFPWVYDTRGGIFNLFNQPYWYALVALLALAITTCTVSRFAPIRRTVLRPPKRVGDAYFERARHRFDFASADGAAIADALRARRFRVETEQREGGLYVFADRFQWAQFATFITHLALIMLVLGTLITKFGGEEFQFWVGEGQSHPLFAPGSDRPQIQVIVDDAIARFSPQGQALDFRSRVRVAEGGEEVAAGDVTVNGPLHAAGYRVHQASYWEHGAALQVHDTGSGQLLYSETLFLDQQLVGPRVRIEDAASGQVFTEEVVPLSSAVAGAAEGAAYTLIPLDRATSLALVLIPQAEGGFRFHYSLLPVGADAPEARGLDADTLGIGRGAPYAPLIRLVDPSTGETLVEGPATLMQAGADGLAAVARYALFPLPNGERLAVGLSQPEEGTGFFYFNVDNNAERGTLEQGGRVAVGGLELAFDGVARDPSLRGTLAPDETRRIGRVLLTYLGAASVFFTTDEGVPGADAETLIGLDRFGDERTAGEFNARGGEDVDLAVGGDSTASSAGGVHEQEAKLILGLGGGQAPLELRPGESAVRGGYEYTFLGPREFTGLNVRRDPGATLFWIAIGMGVFGMTLTFFVPRRRIWARVTGDRTYLAGQAGHGINLRAELAALGEALTPGHEDRPGRRRGWFGDDYAPADAGGIDAGPSMSDDRDMPDRQEDKA